MFAGKTSRLIELLEREVYAGHKIVLFKPQVDHRYSDTDVVTHKGEKLSAITLPTTESGLDQIRKIPDDIDVIGVDEGQFWPAALKLANVLDELAYKGKTVYVAILNKDHFGKPFNNIDILARADYIHSLTAICKKCGHEATFVQRIRDGKEVFGIQVEVGGMESYEPRCRNCFVRPTHA